MTLVLDFIAAFIFTQILFVVAVHTVFYVRAACSGLGWSVQDYFTSLGVTMLGALGIWGRAIMDLGAKCVELGRRIAHKLGAKC